MNTIEELKKENRLLEMQLVIAEQGFAVWKEKAEATSEALEYLVNDIKSKPNNTRYATAIKKAEQVLELFNQHKVK